MYEFLYESLYRAFKCSQSIQLQKIVTMIIVPPLISFERIYFQWMFEKKEINFFRIFVVLKNARI